MNKTTHSKILKLLSDGEWHHSNEICSPWIGGRQGISRICELRKKGYKIENRKSPLKRGKEYRILQHPIDNVFVSDKSSIRTEVSFESSKTKVTKVKTTNFYISACCRAPIIDNYCSKCNKLAFRLK